MTGLFSLLDVLINMPMPEILKELPLQDEVVEALRDPLHSGPLGKLLWIVTQRAGNFAAVEDREELDISARQPCRSPGTGAALGFTHQHRSRLIGGRRTSRLR